MTRLGENVFQFPLASWLSFLASAIVGPFIFFFLFIGFIGIIGLIGTIVFGIFLLAFIFLWCKILLGNAKNYRKSGLILDKEKGHISVCKWTWNLRTPCEVEIYPLSEILSFGTDIDVKTETKLVGSGSDKHWETRETRTHNIVLHGKFGSKRVSLASLDDWNLFQTLVSSEE